MPAVFDFTQYLMAIPKSLYRVYKKRILPDQPRNVAGEEQGVNLLDDTLSQSGVVTNVSMTVTDPYAQLEILFDGVEYAATVNEIFTANVDQPREGLPYITTYNPSLDIYSLSWAPYRTFNDNVVVLFNNNSPTPVRIIEMIVEIYLFKSGFYKALAKAKRGESDVFSQ